MAIFGGKILSGDKGNDPTINLVHIFLVAPWLYYLSTSPADWSDYLRLTALAVGVYHGYRAFGKMNANQNNGGTLQKGDQTVLSMMF